MVRFGSAPSCPITIRRWPGLGRWLAVGLAPVALALAGPKLAAANGNHTHIGISLLAIDLLPAGDLKTLVSDPAVRPMLLNGTVFPDGGYAVGHPYGEAAHWEPYQRKLVARVRAACPDPMATLECRQKFAFLLGMASHGMADQVFDALYMDAAKKHDAANWSDELLLGFDTSTDVLWVAERGGVEAPSLWLPMPELLATFQEVGIAVEAATIEDGQTVLLLIVLGYGNNAAKDPKKVAAAKERYPWGAAHLLDPHTPGSPPSEAKVVASYWRQLWSEWAEGAAPSLEVLATLPSEGGGGLAGDKGDPTSTAAIVLSRGVDAASVQATALQLLAGGAVVPGDRNLFYGEGSHVLRLRPKTAWPSGEVTLRWAAGGLKSFDGFALATGGEVVVAVGPSTAIEPGLPPPGWSLALPSAGTGGDPGDAAGGCEASPARWLPSTGRGAWGVFSVALVCLALRRHLRRRDAALAL